jgi:hypothetical protein
MISLIFELSLATMEYSRLNFLLCSSASINQLEKTCKKGGVKNSGWKDSRMMPLPRLLLKNTSADLSFWGDDLSNWGEWNWPPRYNRNIVESSMKPHECYTLRHRDKSAPGHFGTCVKHFGTKTNRHPDNSTPQLDKSSPQKDKSALVFFKSSLGSGIILVRKYTMPQNL